MAILASLLPLVTHSPVPTAMAPVRPVAPVIIRPLFWLAPDGMAYLNGRPTPYEKFGEVRVLRGRGGVQFDFRGTNGAIRLPDLPDLRLTGSLSIAMWIAPRQYWRSGPGAQLFFRGDARPGFDPYRLVIHHSGTIHFAISNADEKGMDIAAELPLRQWTHVLGTFDAGTGELSLYLNGERVGIARTSRRPFALLDPNCAPGIGIGNVQHDAWGHNQPYDGLMRDVRLYDQVVDPWTAGLDLRPQGIVPAE